MAKAKKKKVAPKRKIVAKRKAPKATAQAVVEQFVVFSNAMDIEGSLSLIADDCVYQNIPFHKSVGIDKIRRDLNMMTRTVKEFRVDLLNWAVNGNVVLTERIDTLAGPGFRVELPVMGIFVVKNGKIVEWRDYLDWSFLIGNVVKGVATSPARLLAERFKK